MSKKDSLLAWLDWISSLSVTEVDLSLERVLAVGSKLGLLKPACPVITVAGTNGKGSTVATLEAMYVASGYKVGAFTSPYLWSYNEQFRLQGISVTDDVICSAFQCIEDVCGSEIKLTIFEYGTLAAFKIFQDAGLDVWILEVGLGGRWDAVNVIDADVAVVTSIGIDHVEWLGNTRELIAREKAGIFRQGKLAVCGDLQPPISLLEEAKTTGVLLHCQQQDFGFVQHQDCFDWRCATKEYKNILNPQLALQNVSTALMAVELLQPQLPVLEKDIKHAIATVSLPGRRQVIPGEVIQILDVAHNPAAVEHLVDFLKNTPIVGNIYAVFSMLADKDIVESIKVIQSFIHHWYVAPLLVHRGASEERLQESFVKAGETSVTICQSIPEAYQDARKRAVQGDCILVFGSFRTVGQIGRAF